MTDNPFQTQKSATGLILRKIWRMDQIVIMKYHRSRRVSDVFCFYAGDPITMAAIRGRNGNAAGYTIPHRVWCVYLLIIWNLTQLEESEHTLTAYRYHSQSTVETEAADEI